MVKFNQKLVDFNRILKLSFNLNPILKLKSKSSLNGRPNWLELSTIRLWIPNRLSLQAINLLFVSLPLSVSLSLYLSVFLLIFMFLPYLCRFIYFFIFIAYSSKYWGKQLDRLGRYFDCSITSQIHHSKSRKIDQEISDQ